MWEQIRSILAYFIIILLCVDAIQYICKLIYALWRRVTRKVEGQEGDFFAIGFLLGVQFILVIMALLQ